MTRLRGRPRRTAAAATAGQPIRPTPLTTCVGAPTSLPTRRPIMKAGSPGGQEVWRHGIAPTAFCGACPCWQTRLCPLCPSTFPLPPPALLELYPHPPLPALPIPNRYVVMVAMIASAGGLLFGECLRVGCLPAHYTRLVGPACVCTLHCMFDPVGSLPPCLAGGQQCRPPGAMLFAPGHTVALCPIQPAEPCPPIRPNPPAGYDIVSGTEQAATGSMHRAL